MGSAQAKSRLTQKLQGFQESIMLCDARTEQLRVVFANHAAQKLLGGSSAARHPGFTCSQPESQNYPAASLLFF